jgi:hypothetical protein
MELMDLCIYQKWDQVPILSNGFKVVLDLSKEQKTKTKMQ